MQTQTMVRQDAFAGIINEITPEAVYIESEDKHERYFFYPGDEPGRKHPGGLSVNSPCIPYRVIRRCQVTPCVTRQVSARIEEIPEGARIPGTIGHRIGFAKYWLASGPEANTLLSNYGNKADFERDWGLIELLPKILTGMSYARYAELQITEAIFPQWPDIPETNQGVSDHLYGINSKIEDNHHEWFKWSLNDSESIRRRDIYLVSILQMLEAVEAAQTHQVKVVTASNIAVTLPSTEPGYKRSFDERDRLYSLRTGIKLAINSLRQNANDTVDNLVKGLSEKLQPQVAPQLDPAQFAMMATAMVTVLKDQGLLVAPAAVQTLTEPPQNPVATKPKPDTATSKK